MRITLGTGQFCTNPGLLFGIKSAELTAFIENLGKEVLLIQPSVMLHPNIISTFETNKTKTTSQSNIQVVAEYKDAVQPNFAKSMITTVEGETFLKNATLHQEVFGPFSIVVQCKDIRQLEDIISSLEGQLTGTIIAENNEITSHPRIIETLQNRVGRIIYNGVPTGVEVSPSMVHGGPYPSSTDSRFTAVGINSIKRWVRPFSFQDWPNNLLPDELKDENPLQILRVVNGSQTSESI